MTREEAIERAARAINARTPRQRALGVSDGPTADEILMGYLSRDDRAEGDGYFRLAREAARRAREVAAGLTGGPAAEPAREPAEPDPAREPARRAPEKRVRPREAPERSPARRPSPRPRERTMRPAAEVDRRGRKELEPRQPRPQRSHPGLRSLLEACDRWEEEEPERKAV